MPPLLNGTGAYSVSHVLSVHTSVTSQLRYFIPVSDPLPTCFFYMRKLVANLVQILMMWLITCCLGSTLFPNVDIEICMCFQ